MEHEKKLWIKENLTETAPKGCNLKVGDSVEWVNDYGVKFTHKIIGFSETRYPDKVVYLNSEAYWFPHALSTLKLAK